MSSLPSPFFNPQATPVSQFTQPFVAAPTPIQVQVGQGLEDIGPAFMNFSTTLASFVGSKVAQQNKEAAEAGRTKIFQSRQSFRKLVESGKLDPAANPWEAYGAAQADAVLQAESFKSRLMADYEQEIVSNPALIDSVGAFDEFSKKRLQEAASAGIENPIWTNTFLEEVTPSINEMAKRHVVAVGDFRRKKMTDALGVGIASDINDAMAQLSSFDPASTENDAVLTTISGRMQRRIDEVYQTIGGDAANATAIDTAMKLRVEYGDDPRIKGMIEMLKTPAGPIYKTERYRAAEAVMSRELDAARSRMTIEKAAQIDNFLKKQFDPEALRNMSIEQIVAGNGFPSWEEIDPKIRQMGVGTELYFKVKDQYEDLKAEVVRSNMIPFMESLARSRGSEFGKMYAAANGDTEQMMVLAESYNKDTVRRDIENDLRRMGKAYRIPESDVPRSINEAEFNRAAIDGALNSLPVDPTTNMPTRESMSAILMAGRAMGMKNLYRITDQMNAAVELYNQPNADVTNPPSRILFAIDMFDAAQRSNEVEMLGLSKNVEDFLRIANSYRLSGGSVAEGLQAAKSHSAGTMSGLKIDEISLTEFDEKFNAMNNGWFSFEKVAPDKAASFRGVVQGITTMNLINRMGKDQAVEKAFEEAFNKTVIVNGSPVYAPMAERYKGLAKNPDAWQVALNEAVERINKQISAQNANRTAQFPLINKNTASFVPRSYEKSNVIFDLIDSETGQPLDFNGFANPGFKTSYTLQELVEISASSGVNKALRLRETKKRPGTGFQPPRKM